MFLMRDEKEERKKQARSNKQTRQSNTYMYIYTCIHATYRHITEARHGVVPGATGTPRSGTWSYRHATEWYLELQARHRVVPGATGAPCSGIYMYMYMYLGLCERGQ